VQWHEKEFRRRRVPELPVIPKRGKARGQERMEREVRGLTRVQRMKLARVAVLGLCLGAFVGWGIGVLWDAVVIPMATPREWDFPRVTPGDRLEYAPRSPRPWGNEL
jgi:hypothetical protein